MRTISATLLMLLFFTSSYLLAQPYVDIVNIRYIESPPFGERSTSANNSKLTYFNFSTTLPLVLKSKDAIIVSPYFERWQLQLAGFRKNYYGIVLPLSYLNHINADWSLLTTAILRWNDSSAFRQMHKQVGGAIIVSRKVHPGLTYKAGLYVNHEYFGLFIMPLLGIDWQINKKDGVFGVLPGYLVYQHEINKLFKYGVSFRAQTNSYYKPVNNFIRIDENQLGAYLDFYAAKQLVLNLEAGHSILRKLRSQKTTGCNCKYNMAGVKDNLYMKISVAYRVGLR